MIGEFMETIAAIATPSGKGGVAIIRISGENAHECLEKLIKKPIEQMRKMYLRGIYAGDILLDKCLCVKFDNNASYTGEKTAEIQCHGGYASANDILNQVLSCGARLAQNGEFTKRAFLNGRIDLSQAEAVGDMIDAQTQSASRAAARLLSGALGEKIRSFQDSIKELLTAIEAGIDYPDEIDEEYTDEKIIGAVKEMIPQIDELILGYERGRITVHGLKVCILGKPNAGKSSLLNALCGRERAIVTPIAGTTRDTLHETLDILGVKTDIYDTAGLRRSDDVIEQAGVDRSRLTAKESDVVLAVSDSGEQDDFLWLEEVKDKHGLIIFNKCDLGSQKSAETNIPVNWQSVSISAKSGEGMEKVVHFLEKTVRENDSSSSLAITSQRHFEALKEAKKSLEACLNDLPPDLKSIDLTAAWSALGVITGQNVTEDIVNNIFEKFCVGK